MISLQQVARLACVHSQQRFELAYLQKPLLQYTDPVNDSLDNPVSQLARLLSVKIIDPL